MNPDPSAAGQPEGRAEFSPAPDGNFKLHSTTRPGGHWVPPEPEVLQEELSQYRILEILGCGGMGAVYKGWQISLERYVAIKILPPNVDDGDTQFTVRFKQEAKTMAKFQHPGIVSVYDAGETQAGLLYIVMEFIEGTDVAKMTRAQGKLPPQYALAITAHVCDALQYAHSHGVIHRDIKPANVLINMEGAVKVADFGLAKDTDLGQSSLTRVDVTMGTPDYLAPEGLIVGLKLDGRADLYALGVMLYHMLTGQLPRGVFEMPSFLNQGETDERLDEIVARALEQDREKRYQIAAEMRRDLDVILSTPLLLANGASSSVIPKHELAVVHQQVAKKPLARRPGMTARVPHYHPPTRQPAAQLVSYVPEKKSMFPAFLIGALVMGFGVFAWLKFGPHPAAPTPVAATPAVSNQSSTAPVADKSTLFPERVLTFGGHRYLFLLGPFEKDQEREKAKILGGHVLTINSAEEQQWIEQTYGRLIAASRGAQCHIGGSGSGDGRWTWQTSEPWSYTKWDAGFPRVDTNTHLVLKSDNKGGLAWQNSSWSNRACTIVEWDDLTTPIPVEPMKNAFATTAPAPSDALLFNGHRYKLIRGYVSWYEARDQALDMGGHLATINSAAEDEWVRRTFVDDLAPERMISIGAFRIQGSKEWLWITGEPWSQENWRKQQDTPDARGAYYQCLPGGTSQWVAVWSPSAKISISSGPDEGQQRSLGFLVEWESDRTFGPPLASGNSSVSSGPPTSELTFAGHRYRFVPDRTLTWTQAKAAAEKLGGHLATITSKEQDDWVARNIIAKFELGKGVWIGGTDQGSPGQWRWVTGEPFGYTNWNRGEPTNVSQEIALLFSRSDSGDLGWGDLAESRLERVMGYLVEWEDNNSPSTSPTLAGVTPVIDLLPTVDLRRDIVRSAWEFKPDGLFTTPRGDRIQLLEFNLTPPEEYDYEVEFTITSGSKEVLQILSVPTGLISFNMGPFGDDPSAFGFGRMLDNTDLKAPRTEAITFLPRFKDGQRHRCTVEVRKGSLRALLDGKEILKWSGDFARFKNTNWAELPNKKHLGLGVYNTSLTFHKVELHLRGPVFDRLAQFETQFKEAWERDITNGTSKAITDLDGKYLVALDGAIADATKSGRLDDVVNLRQEKQRMIDKAPLPAADAVNIVASLKKLRDIYRKANAPLVQRHHTATAQTFARYEAALEEFQKDLTRQNHLEDALAVKAKRGELEKLRHPAAPAPVLVTASLPATAPTSSLPPTPIAEVKKPTSLPKPSAPAAVTTLPEEMLKEALPAKPFTPAEAVQWALSLGGSATIKKGSGESDIPDISRLPKGKFTLIGLKLGEKQPLHVVSLAALSGMTDLRDLTLDNNLITDAGLAFLPVLPKLTHLSMNGCGLTDEGLAHMRKQTTLTELSARDNHITGAGLKHLATLPGLSILEIGSMDLANEGVPFLASLAALQKLDLSCSKPLKLDSLAALSEIKKLKTLTLGSSATDPTVSSLKGLITLESLNLSRAPISDTAMDGVAALKGLKDLNLHQCPNLTDYGLTKLVSLRGLLKLDLGETRLTDTGFKTLSTKLSEIGEINAAAAGMSDGGLAGLENMRKLSRLTVHVRMCTDLGTSYIRKVAGLRIISIEQMETLNPARMAALRHDLPSVNFGRP